MSKINVKIERNLVKKAKEIAVKKYPLRNIEFYVDAVKEALIEFVEENKTLLDDSSKKVPENNTKIITQEG